MPQIRILRCDSTFVHERLKEGEEGIEVAEETLQLWEQVEFLYGLMQVQLCRIDTDEEMKKEREHRS